MDEKNEPVVRNIVAGEVHGEVIQRDVVHGDLVFGSPEPEPAPEED